MTLVNKPTASAASQARERPADHRKCVGVVLFGPGGRAFVARRVDAPGAPPEASQTWQFPQGGIDKGEDAEAAARRELREETGVRSAELLAEFPGWLCYRFPKDVLLGDGAGKFKGGLFKGKFVGQAQRWFYFRFTGSEAEIDISGHGGEKAEFQEWKWMDLEQVPAAAVAFKRPVYEAVARHGREAIAL